jgi:hypothetical protein
MYTSVSFFFLRLLPITLTLQSGFLPSALATSLWGKYSLANSIFLA